MPGVPRSSLSRRADYTHQHNVSAGRYGWLRLTPAYSLKIVSEILADLDEHADARVLDPFCGTGTTALCASYYGQAAVTTEINPFLVWLSRAKTDYYAPRMVAGLRAVGQALADDLHRRDGPRAPLPQMRNLERWWNSAALDFLCSLKGAIDARFASEVQPHTLLLLAFCRTLIKLSDAAFNHQSMSFQSTADGQDGFDFRPDWPVMFQRELNFVLDGALINPTGEVQVVQADARQLPALGARAIDCVVTSPPYVNRMSYIRELRPYMYWLGHLENGRDAGEMDWTAIGGTWGVATSRLTEWSPAPDGFRSARLQKAAVRIAADTHKNGALLATYVRKYFDDMWRHFRSLTDLLGGGAGIHYIVGNSSFYRILVPVERIYAEMLAELGFTDIRCRPIRKRNSKKELLEFEVSARWR